MKKLFLSLCIAVSALSLVKANDAELFSYDRNALETAISAISAVENFVAQNPEISVNDLAKTGNLLVNGFEMATNPFGLSGEPALGIPSFLWGCVLGWVGLLVVFIVTDNDKEQVKKALFGCLTSGVVGIIIYIIVIATAVSTVNTVTPTYY